MTMPRTRFMSWLREWVSHHPLRAPQPSQSSACTAHVMSRVRALSQPRQPAVLRSVASLLAWWRQPQLALVMGAVLLIVGTFTLMPRDRGAQVIAEMDADERWIEDTLELLNEIEELPEELSFDAQSTDEWWQELQELDDTEWPSGNV